MSHGSVSVSGGGRVAFREAAPLPVPPPLPWLGAVLSAWRKEGRVLGSLGEKVLCPRVGLTPHIYDLNLYSARRGSKCLQDCHVQTRSGLVNRLFCV